jgi:hypothetical protein
MKKIVFNFFLTTINSSFIILLGVVGNLVANLEKPLNNNKTNPFAPCYPCVH